VFENARKFLRTRIHADIVQAPCYSNGVLRRLWIVDHARRRQGAINHVTGDTNFTALGLDGRRTVLTNHDCGFVIRSRGIKRWILKKFWLDWPVRHVAAVTTVSSQIKQEIIELTGCHPDKVHVIPNAASGAFKPISHEFAELRPRILHLGTAPNKNLPRLVRALTGRKCILVIVGRLSREVTNLLRVAKVDYENYVDLTLSQLIAQYQACDIVSFASTYEGFGVPILEAQAVGRPLITSDRAPMNEVAGKGACLVDPEDVAALGMAFDRIVGDARYRNELVEAGFENVKRFSPERIADMYYRLYEQVLAGCKALEGDG
jgi:glycosyltransferase involved in cell wall biosynthesis